MNINQSITIENNKSNIYLCTWNDGDIVQVHTKETLKDEYKDTNLFDVDEDRLVND